MCWSAQRHLRGDFTRVWSQVDLGGGTHLGKLWAPENTCVAVTEESCSETINSVFRTGDVQKHVYVWFCYTALIPLPLPPQSRVLARMSSVLIIRGMPLCWPVLPSSVPAVRMRRPPPPGPLSVDDQCIQMLVWRFYNYRIVSFQSRKQVCS